MRAQAHTLEAVIGSLVLLSSFLIALQMTTVTPLSASTSSQFIENQQRSAADGALTAAGEVGWLKKAVLYWNPASDRFHEDTDTVGYTGTQIPADNRLGEILEKTFVDERVAYNVYIVNRTDDGLKRRRYIYSGTPSDKAVSVSRTVAILDGDLLVNQDGSLSGTTVSSSSSYYMDDRHTSSILYRVVRVEVIVWKN